MTRLFLGLSIMAVLGFFSNSQAVPKVARVATAPKIAFVNIQKIISLDPQALGQVSAEWRDLYGKIQEILEPAQKEIADLRDKYEKGKKDFQGLQSSGAVSQEALKRKYEEVARVEYELSMRMQEIESYAQNEVKKAQGQVGPKLDKVINDIRIAQGWDLVLRGEAVLAGADQFDITDDVLTALNKGYIEEKAKKAKEKEKEPVKKTKTV